ncbi:MAG: serine/threonine-protein kinase [Elusimicrobiota bacterium]
MVTKVVADKYVIIEQLGEPGGFGTVYKAWARNLEKFVALKKLHDELVNDNDVIEMFHAEAVNTAKLEHENIVRVIDYLHADQNSWYIVMEYVRGCNLRYLLNKVGNVTSPTLPIELSVFIIIQTLRGLDYAHHKIDDLTSQNLGIVHRDVTPANIMIYFDSQVKLADFGIAKILSASKSSYNKVGSVVGKFAYMSPEQANNNLSITNRSDIFSAGLVLYELLAGKRAYSAPTDTELWEKARRGQVDYQFLEMTNIPSDLIEVLQFALNPVPERRYDSAREMAVDLQRWLSIREWGSRVTDLREYVGRLLLPEIQEEEKKTLKLRETLQGLTLTTQHKKEQFAIQSPQKDGKPELISVETVHTENKDRRATTGDAINNGLRGIGEKLKEKRTVIPRRDDINEDDIELKNPKIIKKVPEKSVSGFKYGIYIILGILVFGLLSYLFIDTVFQITPQGTYWHSRLWKPAFVLDCIPPQAEIVLSKVKGNNKSVVTQGITPLLVQKLKPGTYELKLTKLGYAVLITTVSVNDNGLVKVVDVTQNMSKLGKTFVIPFETVFSVRSIPPGAKVVLDGKQVESRTPVEDVLVKVIPHDIVIYPPEGKTGEGFAPIVITVDLTKEMKHALSDPSSSELVKGKVGTIERFVLSTKFKRMVSINSKPDGAAVYIDSMALGVTPLTEVALSVGVHSIRIEKQGLDAFEGVIDLTGNKPKSLFVYNLEHVVKFTAVPLGGDKDQNLSVGIENMSAELIAAGQTPFTQKMLPGKYGVIYALPNQIQSVNKKIFVTNDTKEINVLQLAEANKVLLDVLVVNSRNNAPIPEVAISINGGKFRYTNNAGIWQGYVDPGKISVAAGKSEYGINEVNVNISAGEKKSVVVKLNPE